MLTELERKKLLIQDDTQSWLELADKIKSYLENRENNLNKINQQLKKFPEIQSEIVKFNVGGTNFATYKSN